MVARFFLVAEDASAVNPALWRATTWFKNYSKCQILLAWWGIIDGVDWLAWWSIIPNKFSNNLCNKLCNKLR